MENKVLPTQLLAAAWLRPCQPTSQTKGQTVVQCTRALHAIQHAIQHALYGTIRGQTSVR